LQKIKFSGAGDRFSPSECNPGFSSDDVSSYGGKGSKGILSEHNDFTGNMVEMKSYYIMAIIIEGGYPSSQGYL